MSSQAYSEVLAKAINRTGFVEIVEASFVENRVSVLLRVKAGVDHRWLEVVHRVLLVTEFRKTTPYNWNAHICKTFFLKEIKKEKKLVFGWTVAITSSDLPKALYEVVRVIDGGEPELRELPPNQEVTEFPLVGAPLERNAPGAGGKGASAIGGKSGDFHPPVRR